MAEKTFDITMAFDDAKYLNPQLYMFFDSLIDKLPENTVVHIVTNRYMTDDVISYILKLPIKVKYYYNDGNTTKHLKSRCKYMLNCFNIDTDKDWIVKLECDMLALKHLNELYKVIDDKYDIIIEQERRRMIDNDVLEKRIWKNIYNAMDIKCPTDRFITTEDRKMSLPLFGTGVIFIKSKLLPIINKYWIDKTNVCEKWIEFNIHPNEFAFTGIIYDNKLKFNIFPTEIYDFNPISYYRDGEFPSQKLIDDIILPDDIVIFSYHRAWWLEQLLPTNKKLNDIVDRNMKYIPNDWWELNQNKFMEKSNVQR